MDGSKANRKGRGGLMGRSKGSKAVHIGFIGVE
jgi:hypothetical protein